MLLNFIIGLMLNNNILQGLSSNLESSLRDIIKQDSMTHKLMNYQIQDVMEFVKLETQEFTFKF